MKTWQDLARLGENEGNRAAFVRVAVDEFRATAEYRDARNGEAYYNKHNLTIERFQKMLYTVMGTQIPDVYSANYKLKTLFFRRLVVQQIQYILGNGCNFRKAETKKKLGRDFDFKLQTAATRAMVGGSAFLMWNNDHVEVFGYADTASQMGFCPLYDEKTGDLVAGIRYRFRRVADDVLFIATLFEQDGYTEYRQTNDDDVRIASEKMPYKIIVTRTDAGGVESVEGENYGRLPIVPLYANDAHESELNGIRECIDCYDYIKSGLANDIDDTSGFYWIVRNTGGMDDVDLAQFVERMKTVRAATVDADDGGSAEAHTFEIPTEARRTMLELLRSDIYEDFQALDVKTLSAAAKTAVEIRAAYQAQDNKSAQIEYFIIDAVQKLLEIAGIDDEPSFNWNRIVNQTEETQMIMTASAYLDDETIIKKLPFLTPEEAEEVLKRRDAEDIGRFDVGKDDTEQEDGAGGAERAGTDENDGGGN